MSTETPQTQEHNQEPDAFAIFGMTAESIDSYQEPERKDWSKIFYEPDPSEKSTLALIKFLPNIYDAKNPLQKRFTYKLPNPDRPSSNFTFVSPTTIDQKCPVVSAWYDLKDSKDARLNAIAEKLKRKRTRCAVIQIVSDPQHPELTGQLRLFRFQYDGDIDKLIKKKLEPTEDEIKTLGAKKENVFDPFNSPIMILRCAKGDYGRDFAGSEWAPSDKNMGMILQISETEKRALTLADATNPEIQKKVVELLKSENVNIKEHYMYKHASAETMALVTRSLSALTDGSITINASSSEEDEPSEMSKSSDAPKADAPKADAPKADAPKADAPTSTSDLLAELGLKPEGSK